MTCTQAQRLSFEKLQKTLPVCDSDLVLKKSLLQPWLKPEAEACQPPTHPADKNPFAARATPVLCLSQARPHLACGGRSRGALRVVRHVTEACGKGCCLLSQKQLRTLLPFLLTEPKNAHAHCTAVVIRPASQCRPPFHSVAFVFWWLQPRAVHRT